MSLRPPTRADILFTARATLIQLGCTLWRHSLRFVSRRLRAPGLRREKKS